MISQMNAIGSCGRYVDHEIAFAVRYRLIKDFGTSSAPGTSKRPTAPAASVD